jgi:hypothetical protein
MATKILAPYGNDFKCETIQESFFRDHLPCYTEGPLSFCTLPLTDSVRVLWHAKDIMWKGYLHESTESGFELLKVCGMQAFTFNPEDPEMFYDYSKSVATKSHHTPLDEFEQALNDLLSIVGWEVSVVNTEGNIVIGMRRTSEATESYFDESTIMILVNSALSIVFEDDQELPKYSINTKSDSTTTTSPKNESNLIIAAAVVGSVAVATMGFAIFLSRRRQHIYERSEVF